MVPALAGKKRVSRLKQVVLPAPLGPISAWMVPRKTRRSTRLTATNPRNSLERPRVSRITSAASGTGATYLQGCPACKYGSGGSVRSGGGIASFLGNEGGSHAYRIGIVRRLPARRRRLRPAGRH